MSQQYFRSLLFKSGQIQEQIDVEQKQKRPNWLRLLKLKKLRLLIADRMHQLVRYNKPRLMPIQLPARAPIRIVARRQ